MDRKDLGYDLKTGLHSRILTDFESKFLGILWTDHFGADEKISAIELAVRFDCALKGFEPDSKILPVMVRKAQKRQNFEIQKREVRRIQLHLLKKHDNIPVLSKAGNGGGYWIAGEESEAAAFYETFKRRGMTGLIKASRGKKAALVDMMEQVTFEFEDMAADVGMPDNAGVSGDPAAIAVVDSFLGRMLESPDRFSAGLKKLSNKYGSILLGKAEVAEMKIKAAELSIMVESLGV